MKSKFLADAHIEAKSDIPLAFTTKADVNSANIRMRQSHIIFNVLALVIAGLLSLSILGQMTSRYPATGIIFALVII
ncbi:MAG TPA: hypothetical protein VH255_10285, partial [Verrucomicrobiae bacterium]|nr:hypothetical protein [Verrucomicrobiae bacterium]